MAHVIRPRCSSYPTFNKFSFVLLRGILSVSVVITAPRSLSAQEKLLPVYHFNHLTTADGLPSNNILSRVCRDSRGFVWIGTGNGLARYDGYSFKTYRNVLNDSSSISSSMIFVVTEDSRHRLWVGTYDAGLSLYDPVRDRFVNFRPRPGDSTWLQTRTVLSMLEDSAGVLWLGTNGGKAGIVRVELPIATPENDVDSLVRAIRFRTYALGTPRNSANDLRMHSDGRILVASDSGLLFFNRRTCTVSRPDFPGSAGRRLSSVLMWCLIQDHFANLWLLTSGGLLKINWKDGELSDFRHSKDDSLSISRDNILDGTFDRQGNLWLASSEGVDLFSPVTGRRTPYLTFGTRPFGNAAMQLSLDRTGTLWISTGGGGLFWLSEKSTRFPHFSIGSPGGWTPGFESIERTPDGEVWICSWGKVFQLEVQTRSFVKTIDVLRGTRATYWDSNIHTSLLDKYGNLWYGIWGPGLYNVDLATQHVKNFRYPDQIDKGDAAVRSIAPGTKDSLWIGATLDGLWKFDPASGKFVRGSRTVFGRANDVLKDRYGRIWVATIFDGLYRIDPAIDSVEHFVHDEADPHSLSNDRTNNLFEDPQGRIWFSAVNVINLWNPSSRTFSRYPNPAFPDANAARVIGSDRKGRLWVSYGGGQLSMFDPVTGQFVNFDASDGVCGNVIDMENLDDGKVLLSGSGGLNICDPDSVLDVRGAPPPLAITRMSINDQSVVLSTMLDKSGSLRLPFDQNVIELEFAALDVDAPQHVEYRYRLEGLENKWVEPRGRRFVRYAGLRPGEYIFSVEARSLRHEWAEQAIRLAISIAPPWWQTRWAYAAYVMLLIGIIATGYRIRMKQLHLEQHAAMDHFQAERLAEIDRLKSRFFANISHEFRTPLTLILGPAEQVIESTQEPSTRQKLHLIKNNTERLRSLVNQLLDLARLESGTMRLQVSCNNVVGFLRRTVMSFESWAERKHINLEFQSDPKTLQGHFDSDKLEKIVNNLVSNAVKFTPDGGTVRVALHHQFRNQKSDIGYLMPVTLSITDTGPGIAPEHLPHIFDRFYRINETHTMEGTGIGLALTKELVELHHGTIAVESTPGKGSVFTVSLPMGASAYRPEEITESPIEGERIEQPAIAEFPPASIELPARPIQEGKALVLVVEDNADLRSYIREFMATDYGVQEAKDGKEGYDLAIEVIPDLIISDVMMPNMDGMELCRALKQDVRTSHIPVILLTARAGTDSKIEGLEIGADDYVTKPFDAKELIARVRNLIEQRRQLKMKFSTGVVLKPGEVAVSSLDDTFLKKVMQTVESRMGDENFGAEEIALEVAMSRRHLDRKLKGITNLAAAEFIRDMRLQRARELLQKKAATVAEIAYQVGFGSPSYFTTCFRERFGCLPSQIHGRIS